MKSIIENKFIEVIEQNDADGLFRLLKNHSPDTKLELGFTPLMLCAGQVGSEILAEILINHNASVNIINESGSSPLKIGVIRENIAVVTLLLENGANPNQYDKTGVTPLMYAIRNNNKKIIQLMIEHGGDPYLKSKNGANDSFDFARLTKNEHVLAMLDHSKNETEEIKAEDLVGQATAKRQLNEIISLTKLNAQRQKKALKEISVTLHCVYIGNPGTGKTTFARFFAQEIKKTGLLKSGHLIEVSRGDLIAKFSGQTAEKTTSVFESAMDGILFIDEAYSIKNGDNDQFGQECINTLISLIENHRNRVIVILAGYRDEMLEFLHHNPGLKSRVPNLIEFEDFSNDELEEIMKMMMEKKGLQTKEKNIEIAVKELSKKRKERSFGNAREIRNVIDRGIVQQSIRLTKKNNDDLSAEELSSLIYSDFTVDPNDEGTIEELYFNNELEKTSPLDELNKLVGLTAIKKEIKELADFVEVAHLRNPDKLPEIGLHMVFTGNPGTGKTTVARLLGKLFKEIDLLSSGHVVEVDRSQLVAPFVGQTAIKTKEAIERALGGILFIDEAYTLFRNQRSDNFGLECIDTILKYMEDYRNRLVVIFAGYPKQMETFLQSNPGLKSRLNRFLHFPDYTNDELFKIAQLMAKQKQYQIDPAAQTSINKKLEEKRKGDSFGNARSIRNLLELAYKRHASRLIELKKTKKLTQQDLNNLTARDF